MFQAKHSLKKFEESNEIPEMTPDEKPAFIIKEEYHEESFSEDIEFPDEACNDDSFTDDQAMDTSFQDDEIEDASEDPFDEDFKPPLPKLKINTVVKIRKSLKNRAKH